MPWPVTINGKTYQASDFSPYGYTQSFPNIVQDISDVAGAVAAVANGTAYINSFRNRLINGNFVVNQRGTSGVGASYAAGAFILDGWKAGPGGVSLYFVVAGTGDGVVFITAGTLVQVIEGQLYIGDNTTYTLSNAGTAPGRAYQGAASGTYANPFVLSGMTLGANTTVEFGVGTLNQVQFELGTKRTPFERRDDELRRCRRYFQFLPPSSGSWEPGTPTRFNFAASLPVPMRAAPTLALFAPGSGITDPFVANYAVGSIYFQEASADGALVALTTAAATAGRAGYMHANLKISASAEL